MPVVCHLRTGRRENFPPEQATTAEAGRRSGVSGWSPLLAVKRSDGPTEMRTKEGQALALKSAAAPYLERREGLKAPSPPGLPGR